jgi:5-methylcytosine-specific restriction endonuclease McrA
MRGDMRTLVSKKLRALLYYEHDGKCALCGCELPDDWHADHIVPWVVSHETNVHDMQPLCPNCNRAKGSKMLRKHQQ